MRDGLPVCVQCKRKGNSGRKEVPVDIPKMLAVPFHRRKNIRALGYAMEVSKSTVQRWLKRKTIRRHSNAIKPYLSDPAVGRPRYGADGGLLWDGKIGIFPFTYLAEAKRASKNRPTGTLEVKAVPVIDRVVMKNILIQKLLPAIKKKWPGPTKHVIIQQDNAKPHVEGNNPEFLAAAEDGDWNIELKFQPPNSPDLNVLDLGFFRSIDSIQDQSVPRNLSELINAVTTAFQDIPHEKLNNVFLTLQGVMGEVLKNRGGNNFKIPHIGKAMLAREGRLPDNVGVTQEVYEQAKHFLEEQM
ncbi:unnamed protein product [Cuscuta campestris]|uniref:Tc1-like transposase DDE domain-containing protein n=1 Tax=Cuscuta campestris TaxID=132261 RepID=A0A484NGZ4_9ASTE|nr:unnamed protein product [Cuscuta campestris]